LTGGTGASEDFRTGLSIALRVAVKKRLRANRHVKALGTFADIAAEVGGGATGAVIGFQVGGIEGAVAGAASGSIATRTLRATAVEFVGRTLSRREMERAATVWGYAVAKIDERREAGEQVPQDGFFDDDLTERAAAKEIAEGLLIAAQRQHEERKLPYLGNLYANLVFSPLLDRASANAVLRQAEELSYRQFCLLAILSRRQQQGEFGEHRLRVHWHYLMGSEATATSTFTAMAELLDLERRSLIRIDHGPHSSIPSVVSVTRAGETFCDLLELDGIEPTELEALEALFQPDNMTGLY
jgi:hypothetical protein